MLSQVRLPTAAECARFQRESFGAPDKMMASLSPTERDQMGYSFASAMRQLEISEGFVGRCELLAGAGKEPG